MNIRTLLTASVLLLLSTIAASGDYLYSEQFGFTADFPGAPKVGTPAGSAKDASGSFVSTAVVVSATKPGVDYAFVSVDSYVVPAALDREAIFDAKRDSFLASLGASLTSSHEGTVCDYPAYYFSFGLNDNSASGDVIVVLVQTPKPRIYIVGTSYTKKAAAKDVAALAKFLDTFRIQ